MPGMSLSLCICLNWRPRSSAELEEPPGEPKRGTGDEVDMMCVAWIRGGVLLLQDGGVSGGANADDGARYEWKECVGDMDKWRW